MSGIDVEALSKVYPGAAAPAVDGVSLTVAPGQVFGLLGPNGAGKSSLVGACTTRVLPTAGRVRLAGIDVATDPIAAKRNLGVVPQHNTLDRSLSVWENLYLHCRYFAVPAAAARARADELLDTFQLADKYRAMVPTLSGGQARRLQLARALAHRPVVVFLDEPTVALDPQSRHLLWTLIDGLRAQGVAVLLTTHHMDEADRLCDRVAILDHGRIIACGSPAGLKAGLGADTMIALTVHADPPGLAARLGGLPQVSTATADGDGRLRVLATGGEAGVAAVVQAAAAHQLTGLAVDPVSLETVFLTLTGLPPGSSR